VEKQDNIAVMGNLPSISTLIADSIQEAEPIRLLAIIVNGPEITYKMAIFSSFSEVLGINGS